MPILISGYHQQGRIKAQAMAYRARSLRGPTLSKVKEMCRHIAMVCLTKRVKKMFWIVTCFMYLRVFTEEGSCGAPQNILGLGPLKALIRP